MQVWGVSAAKAGVNLVEGCIAAVDGEKDPRCLLLSFKLVQVGGSWVVGEWRLVDAGRGVRCRWVVGGQVV